MEKGKELVERFRSFIESLTKDDIVAVLHHTDPDGVCSGVIMAKLVEEARGKKIDFRISQKPFQIPIVGSTVETLRKRKANKLIITDLCVDQAPENVKKIEEFAEMLILDHHKIYNDLGSEKTIFIKPQHVSSKKPAAYPASKFCFDMALEIASGSKGIQELDWVAAIGLVGDSAFDSWKDFLDIVFKKYAIEKKQDIYETEIGKAASLISNAESYDGKNAAESFDVVYNAKSCNGVLNSSLQKYRQAVEHDINYWIENFGSVAEKKPGFAFYMINSKFNIKSPISTRLSLKHPDMTIIVCQEWDGNTVEISARRRDEKFAMNSMIEEAIKGLKGATGGGHIPASGATIMKEDLQEFRKRVMKFLKIA